MATAWILVFILHFQVLLKCHQMATKIRFSAAGSCGLLKSSAFLAETFASLQRLPAASPPHKKGGEQKKKKKKKKKADVILSSLSTYTLAFCEVGYLRTVRGWRLES